ncbi:MAG: chromophore lyase CpcT/CpeT [Flavobacteriaceae bacterium]|nr:chromophore lyase CpcT/CpeT [Flavobacteriaceae bacterium]
MKKLTFLLFISLVFSCNDNDSKKANDSIELFELMQGSFDSKNQSMTDSNYFDITLHMYPIWDNQGNFIYVEQSVSSMQEKPYRQRIYEIIKSSDSIFTSIIYKLPNDSLFVGAWRAPSLLRDLKISELQKLEGCEVNLKKVGENHYLGSTKEKSCPSVLYGASYATSEVEILNDKIISWDRGFDINDNQIWGATNGGYVFKKK